jgi:hypothetical protein
MAEAEKCKRLFSGRDPKKKPPPGALWTEIEFEADDLEDALRIAAEMGLMDVGEVLMTLPNEAGEGKARETFESLMKSIKAGWKPEHGKH